MNKENNNSSRGSFIKNLSVAFVSLFGLGLVGFSFQKLQRSLRNRFSTISVSEANNHIAKIHSTGVKQLKPELPPKFKQTSDRLQTNEI